MWLIQELTSKASVFVFSASGRGEHSDTSVFADGERLINMASRVEEPDRAGERIQVQTCEECGFAGCATGGWLVLRRIASYVVWLPAFSDLAENPKSSEYLPPHFMAHKGIPVMSAQHYAEVKISAPALPKYADLPLLNSQELGLALQWEAPGRLLGKFPQKISLRQNAIRAVDHGYLDEQLALLDNLLQQAIAQARPLKLVKGGKQIKFFLNFQGYNDWSPLAYIDNSYYLSLTNRLQVSFDAPLSE